ncbi:MAG: universal stress protein [Chloroflexi bacterium]|nr:universal stress protein [Chloroflexota bacterium]MBM3182802.1 universal stress protein [Chloroflexota bacterium]MBM4451232.1 universal stress protein [Chloroflexota bacterium]MBM4453608.1 universal stress protein [Chloroflexota bacterium]
MAKRIIRKILVPLDGSKTAESVLPYIKYLAKRFGSEVEVLGAGIGRKSRRVNRLLEDYIESAASDLRNEKVEATPVIVYGSAADKILSYSKQNDIDLIVMATHGRSGVTRWWIGSVAEKIVSQAITPVLLIPGKKQKAAKAKKEGASISKILVPLDGSDTGQAALDYVELVARETNASVHLIQVISPPGAMETSVFGNAEWDSFFKAMQDAANDYLGSIIDSLKAKGITAKYDIVVGNPAHEIIKSAEKGKIDLIAMSTHGRTGIVRWVIGSVADKVLHGTRRPMWLVRPPKTNIMKSKN